MYFFFISSYIDNKGERKGVIFPSHSFSAFVDCFDRKIRSRLATVHEILLFTTCFCLLQYTPAHTNMPGILKGRRFFLTTVFDQIILIFKNENMVLLGPIDKDV